MRGSEFLRKLEKVASDRGVDLKVVAERGKGSHQTIYFNDRRTIIPDPKRELKKGTLAGMLKNLGLKLSDLE